MGSNKPLQLAFAPGTWKIVTHGGRYLLYVPDSGALYEVDEICATLLGKLDQGISLDALVSEIAANHGQEGIDSFNEVLKALGSSGAEERDTGGAPILESFAVNIARTCNLGCTYCYAGEGNYGQSAAIMSTATAQQCLAFLKGERAGAPVAAKAKVTFFGGEPILAMAPLRIIAEGLAGLGYSLAMTTNGTLVTDTLAEELNRLGISVKVSLDGPPALQDRFRPASGGRRSSDAAELGLRILLKHLPAERVSVRATVATPDYNLEEAIAYFASCGVKKVGFSPALMPEGYELLLSNLAAQMKKLFHETSAGVLLPLEVENFFLFSPRFLEGAETRDFCGAGSSYFSIGVEGTIYLCHRLTEQGYFVLGHVSRGLDPLTPQLAKLIREPLGKPCAGCWLRKVCRGGCRVVEHSLKIPEGDRHTPTCNWFRTLGELSLLTTGLSKEEPQR